MRMVRAMQNCFVDGRRRRPGEVFPWAGKLGSYMEEVGRTDDPFADDAPDTPAAPAAPTAKKKSAAKKK